MNKHIVRDNDATPFHSSGYARAANGDRMGSVGNTSFQQRQQIEQNRQLVRSYRHSTLGMVAGEIPRSKLATPDTNALRASINPRYGVPARQNAPTIPLSQPRPIQRPPRSFGI